jgi:hypothetical protein
MVVTRDEFFYMGGARSQIFDHSREVQKGGSNVTVLPKANHTGFAAEGLVDGGK